MWTYQQRRSSSSSFRRFLTNPLKIIYERYHYYFHCEIIINCIPKLVSKDHTHDYLLTEILGGHLPEINNMKMSVHNKDNVVTI